MHFPVDVNFNKTYFPEISNTVVKTTLRERSLKIHVAMKLPLYLGGGLGLCGGLAAR